MIAALVARTEIDWTAAFAAAGWTAMCIIALILVFPDLFEDDDNARR